MKHNNLLFKIIGIYFTLAVIFNAVTSHDDDGGASGRIDPFMEILEHKGLNGTTMSADVLDEFVKKFVGNFKCDVPGNPSQPSRTQCMEAACLNSSQLIKLVGSDDNAGITGDQFQTVSIILLHVISNINSVCGTSVDLSSLTKATATANLVSISLGGRNVTGSSHSHLHESDITRLLGNVTANISHDNHDHSHHDDHHHDHHHHDDHDHSNHSNHEDDSGHSHDHTHGDHDHTHGDHDHGIDDKVLVVKEKCLSGDLLMYYMDKDHSVEFDEIGRLATHIVYFIYVGYEVEATCRLLPAKSVFIKNLFRTFAKGEKMLNVEGLVTLMSQLGINPELEDEHGDEHGGGHVDHHRKKRSNGGAHVVELVSREKRQAQNSGQAVYQQGVEQCYGAKQLMAIYDSQNGVNQSMLQEMCSALLSQKLFADCSKQQSASPPPITQAEMYGYSTLATIIICLCSIFGVVFIPCVSKTIYNVIMSTFVGLAVGTLFADAILHLIPMAMGVHSHGGGEHEHEGEEHDHDHEHGDEIMVESYVLYGLAIMAGLYFFYILETVMSKFGGHSHSHDDDEDVHAKTYKNPNNYDMTTTFDEENKLPVEKSGRKSYVVHADEPGMLPDQKPSERMCGLSPVAVMIIVGDGIHNFADGLAIGASFTSGIGTGIATSIAVFCHELPHELGDFAVLMQSGLSFKKALILNLLSALTAFAGLYVSLSITTGEIAQRWIFAVTSGMFLYISLVDLLPQLVKTSGLLNFTLNNIGILIGFAIMLVIAIFEDHIKI